MVQPHVYQRLPDPGSSAVFRLDVSEVLAQSARQRERAERQRNSALSMRSEAHLMRTRMRRDWSRAR